MMGTEMLAQKKRVIWLDVVKYICIVMVMLSHLETRTNVWHAFYSPFFLSAFFFVSGYAYKPQAGFGRFLCKKFRQLFIPWLIFSVFNILLSQIISFNQHKSLSTELMWNFLQIRGMGDEIWFLPALFMAFIPFYFLINWYAKSKKMTDGWKRRCTVALLIAWILSLISILYSRLMPGEIMPWGSSALPWHIEYMFQAMFYMVLGYMFRENFEELFDRYNTVRNRILVWLIYLLVVYTSFFGGGEIPMAVDVFYDYVASLLGITAVVMIAKTMKSNTYINYVGQNTLIYFSLHGKVYSAIQTILKRVASGMYEMILGNTVASSVFVLAFALLLSVLLIVPSYIINRWFPFIVGRTKK